MQTAKSGLKKKINSITNIILNILGLNTFEENLHISLKEFVFVPTFANYFVLFVQSCVRIPDCIG